MITTQQLAPGAAVTSLASEPGEETRKRIKDAITCGCHLRNDVIIETHFGTNLADVLADVHLANPNLFADIQTVFNAARQRRGRV